MPDEESLRDHIAKKIFDKVMGMVEGAVSLETTEKFALAKQRERIIEAQTENQIKLLNAKGDIAVDKVKIDGKYELQAYEEQIKANYQPDGGIQVVWVYGGYEVVVAQVRNGPFMPQDKQRVTNMLTVASEAIKAFPEHGTVSDEKSDPDWVAKFFDSVKDISDEHMQKIWGRILAGEAAEAAGPRKFSMRTLNVLRDLTSEEAHLFHYYLAFCCDRWEIYVPLAPPLPATSGLKRSELTRLVDCGLLLPEREFAMGGFDPQDIRLPFRRKALRFTSSPSRDHWTGVWHALTEAGRQLASLNLPPANEQYLRDLIASAGTKGLKGEYAFAEPEGA